MNIFCDVYKTLEQINGPCKNRSCLARTCFACVCVCVCHNSLTITASWRLERKQGWSRVSAQFTVLCSLRDRERRKKKRYRERERVCMCVCEKERENVYATLCQNKGLKVVKLHMLGKRVFSSAESQLAEAESQVFVCLVQMQETNSAQKPFQPNALSRNVVSPLDVHCRKLTY